VVIFNGMNSLPNFMKIYQLVQKLLLGDTHTQGGNLTHLTLFLRKVGLKVVPLRGNKMRDKPGNTANYIIDISKLVRLFGHYPHAYA
jgi:hypothetical protein